MILPGSYANGFAPRDGMPLYPGLWRGCVGAWAPCLGPTGLTLRDWSAYQRHGTLTSMTAASAWTVDGRHALLFNGVSNYVALNQFPTIGTDDFSFVMTLTIFDISSVDVYLGNASTWFGRNGSAFVMSVGGGSVSGGTMAANTRYRLAVARKSGVLTLYINGISVGSGTLAGSITNSNWALGNFGQTTDATYAANVRMFDAAVYSRAIRDSEIITLSNRPGIAYELAPRRRSRVSVLASLRYNIFTGNVGSLEVIGAS